MKRALLAVITMAVAGSLNATTPVPAHTPLPSVVKNVNARMKDQMRQLQKDVKAGKISKSQASTVKAKIMAIRQEELNDMKANGQKSLTPSQITQLNSELDATQSQV